MDWRPNSYTMYMDDILTPGGSGYRAPLREEGYRSNIHQVNTSNAAGEGYPNSNTMMGTSHVMGVSNASEAVDMRFNPPMGPEMMYYRRGGNYRPGNYVQGVDNTYIPSAPMGYSNPYGAGIGMGTSYTPMSDNGEGKREVAVCRLSEAMKGDNTKHSEIERDIIDLASDVTRHMAGNETEHVTYGKQSTEDTAVIHINIKETVPYVPEEQLKMDSVKEAEKERVEKGNPESKNDGKQSQKGSPKATSTSKEIKSEYFETTKANTDINSGSDTEPVYDSLKTNETESPEKKIKLSLKIKRHTRSSREPIFSIEPQETPDSTQDKEKTMYACEQCDKSYGRKDHLRRHIQSAHSDDRPFVCRVCALTFPRKDRLVRHERVHSGCPQYPCLICGKKFFRKDSLGKHLMTGVGCRQRDEAIFCRCKKKSDETVTDEMVTAEMVTEETVSVETVTKETVTDETVTGETVTEMTIAEETVTGQTVTVCSQMNDPEISDR